MIDETTRQPLESLVERVLRAGTIVKPGLDSLLISRDGGSVAIDNSAAPIGRDGGKIRGVVIVFHNIEERRRLERELRSRADELARADRQKNEFLAMLAHELRNPLAPIANALSVLRLRQDAEAPTPLDPDLDWALSVMGRQVAHMTRLVEDLLDLARITRGKIVLRRQPVELAGLVAQAVESVQPLLTAKRHALSVTLPPETLVLQADPARIEQVLCNLLNNAAKYTSEGGRIELTAEVESRPEATAPARVLIRVADNGIGIAPEVLPNVFELFHQAEGSLDRAQGGLGIGLTLVRTLVELHGGSVEARSAGEGRGSEFLVRLPVAEVLCKASEPTPKRDRVDAITTPTTKRVLVVDDLADSAESLARLLRRWGHEVHIAHDGPSALLAATRTAPEVVLLDIGLPGMDGYEVARRLRDDPARHGIVLVALTGYGQSSDRRHARAAGFDQHLVKPVDVALLRSLLEGETDTWGDS